MSVRPCHKPPRECHMVALLLGMHARSASAQTRKGANPAAEGLETSH